MGRAAIEMPPPPTHLIAVTTGKISRHTGAFSPQQRGKASAVSP